MSNIDAAKIAELKPCPLCKAAMTYEPSDEFEGAINLRCTKCWLRYECTENTNANARRLWSRALESLTDTRGEDMRERLIEALETAERRFLLIASGASTETANPAVGAAECRAAIRSLPIIEGERP